MTIGFEHFDGDYCENFCAALILLCLDEDPRFRDRFADIVRRRSGVPENAPLKDWGREKSLDVDAATRRRSDLWLRFHGYLVLIETKTHSRWAPENVFLQMEDQRRSRLGTEIVHSAILLAPDALTRSIAKCGYLATMTWRELIETATQTDVPSRILLLARDQWSRSVERNFGFAASAERNSIKDSVLTAGCLTEFLCATLSEVGGSAQRGDVLFSSADGVPRRAKGWSWIGLAVLGRIASTRVYLGIYTYVEVPRDEPEAPGTWLELYRYGADDKALVRVPFNPPDLTYDSLSEILDLFSSDYKAKAVAANLR